MKKKLFAMVLIAAAALLISCKADKAAPDQGSESNTTVSPSISARANDNSNSSDAEQAPDKDADSSDAFKEETLLVSGWEITIQNIMRDDTMNNVSVVLGYTDATTNEFEVKASEGYDYFLIKMSLNKKDSKENIEWDKMTLSDSNGNEYKRVEDIFISDLGMKRLPGTTLNFGSYEGWIAFEVKKEAKGLTLKYDFNDEDLTFSFAD